MLEIGKLNTLTILRKTSVGLFLGIENSVDILLPNKYMPQSYDIDDEIEVFIYKDSEDRLIATNLTPLVKVNEFAVLQVKAVEKIGIFLEWGLEKDLMVPKSEIDRNYQINDTCLIYAYLDEKSSRIVATTKINKYLEHENIELNIGQNVDLIVWEETEIGFRVLVNKKYKGMIYKNEIFKPIYLNDALTGHVHTIRDDGKLDIKLGLKGIENIESNAKVILDLLISNQGFLPFNDHTSADVIYQNFKMSKKVFKKSVGNLYKNKLIIIEDKGLTLVK